MAETPTEIKADEKPAIMSLYMPAGGMKGIVPLAVLARVEELTGKPITDLFQVMEGGSVSAFVIAGMNVRDPEDPSKPKYTMKEGLELFVDKTPSAFPVIPQRYLKLAADQWIDVVNKKLDQYQNQEVLENDGGSWLKGAFNIAAKGVRHAVTFAPELAIEGTGKLIKSTWAQDYMYDPKKLEQLYKDVLGEDTRLSDCKGTVYLPAYNAQTQRVEFFVCKKEDILHPNSGDNALVTHGDPKLWEVAMAATASNFAYPAYRMGDGLYMDGALFHEPSAHNKILKDEIKAGHDDASVRLVEINIGTPKAKTIGATLDASNPFNTAVNWTSGSISTENTTDVDELDQNFQNSGGPLEGATEGGLGHVRNYIQDIRMQNAVTPYDKANTISISPAKPDPAKGEPALPGADVLDASPEGIKRILDYSAWTLENQDHAIRELSRTLVNNMRLRGEITTEEYDKIIQKINDCPVEKSEVPAFLKSLSEPAPETTRQPVPASVLTAPGAV